MYFGLENVKNKHQNQRKTNRKIDWNPFFIYHLRFVYIHTYIRICLTHRCVYCQIPRNVYTQMSQHRVVYFRVYTYKHREDMNCQKNVYFDPEGTHHSPEISRFFFHSSTSIWDYKMESLDDSSLCVPSSIVYIYTYVRLHDGTNWIC